MPNDQDNLLRKRLLQQELMSAISQSFLSSEEMGTLIRNALMMAGMVISHEVEAYISVGLDPIEYLAVPRFLGVTVSVFLLNIYFSLFGLAGSFVVAQIFNSMPADVYFGNLLKALSVQDVFISIVKSLAFGMIISVVALTRGFAVERASTDIPKAGLHAVGSAFAWCIMVDIVLSAMYYIVLM
jgi:phospholipid/cholesterol/gamma-HCH transport system permease protein